MSEIRYCYRCMHHYYNERARLDMCTKQVPKGWEGLADWQDLWGNDENACVEMRAPDGPCGPEAALYVGARPAHKYLEGEGHD